jgi:hypothetical protein
MPTSKKELTTVKNKQCKKQFEDKPAASEEAARDEAPPAASLPALPPAALSPVEKAPVAPQMPVSAEHAQPPSHAGQLHGTKSPGPSYVFCRQVDRLVVLNDAQEILIIDADESSDCAQDVDSKESQDQDDEEYSDDELFNDVDGELEKPV